MTARIYVQYVAIANGAIQVSVVTSIWHWFEPCLLAKDAFKLVNCQVTVTIHTVTATILYANFNLLQAINFIHWLTTVSLQ